MDTIEIDKLALVERILIPMQNLSYILNSIAEGQVTLDPDELTAGFSKARSTVDDISSYIEGLQNGETEERTLRLPSMIKEMVEEMNVSKSNKSFG